jgi:hypothetical protein
VQQRQELLVVLAHATADDDQVGPEQVLDDAEVALEALGPLLEVELLPVAHGVGGAGLGVVAVDLQVTELEVRHEHALDDHRGADPGAQGADERDPARGTGGAEGGLGVAGGVGVVHGDHASAQGVAEHGLDVGADPRGVDVRCAAGHAVLHDRGEGDADRGVGGQVEGADQLGDGGGDGGRGGGLRGGDPHAVRGELAGGQVDRGALDPGSADVDAEGHAGRGGVGGGGGVHGSVRISAPVSVTRRVCSNWALRRRSAVTTVHPSSHISQSGVPRLSIGSMVKTMPGSISRS